MYQKHILFLLCLFPFPIFVNNRYSAGWAKVDVGPQVTFQQKRYVTDAGRQINFQQKRYVTDKGRQMNFQQKLCDWRGPKWHFSNNVTWLTRGAKLTFSKNITLLTRAPNYLLVCRIQIIFQILKRVKPLRMFLEEGPGQIYLWFLVFW